MKKMTGKLKNNAALITMTLIGGLTTQAAHAISSTSYNSPLNFQASTDTFSRGPGTGNFNVQQLAGTTWNNSGNLGAITPLNFSYTTIGQTGTYCALEVFGRCQLELPSIGPIRNDVHLGDYGAAVPVQSNGRAAIDLSYKPASSTAQVVYPYDSKVAVTQVDTSIYRIDTAATTNNSGGSLTSKTGLPQANVDLNYDLNARVGSLTACVGSCISAGGGGVFASGAKTTNIATFNKDNDGKLVVPGKTLDPLRDPVYNQNGITAQVFSPNLGLSATGMNAAGVISGTGKAALLSLGYDICSVIPYCFNFSDRLSGDLGSLGSYSAEYKLALLSLVAGTNLSLQQQQQVSATGLKGILNFADSVNVLTKDGTGFKSTGSATEVAFTPGQSLYVDIGNKDTLSVAQRYILDANLHNRTDLIIDAFLREGIIQGNITGRIDYAFDLLGQRLTGDLGINESIGPLLSATQQFQAGFINLFDDDIRFSSDFAGEAFSLKSTCTPQDLIVTRVGSDNGVGSLLNAIQCANVFPDSTIYLTPGLGNITNMGFPTIDNDVTVFNDGNVFTGFDGVRVVPEPSTIALLLAALGGLVVATRKSQAGRKERKTNGSGSLAMAG